MKTKAYYIIAIQSIVIVALLVASAALYAKKNSKADYSGLLSPRVYAGILEPKSFLIVNYAPLRIDFESYIRKNNLNVSIYIENLRNGAFIGVNERERYSPASLNKVITAILIMKKVEDKKLSLDREIEIEDKFKSNAFGDLYKAKEKKLPLKILLEKMMKESDDTAFKILNSMVNVDDRNLVLSYLDYYGDNNFTKSEENVKGLVTPKAMYNVFSSLYLSTLLEPKDSEYILSLLTDTVFDIKKIADLPDNVTVAQKFASKYIGNEKYLHSCGIIYIGATRVFYCIMTKDLAMKNATDLIGAMVHNVYSYTVDTKGKLDYYRDLYDFE